MIRWFRSVAGYAPKDAIQTVLWFLHDFVFRYKERIVVIVLLGLSAASIQGGVLFLINSFITKSQLSENLYKLFLVLKINISMEQFLLLLIILSLTISAVFVLMQARLTLKLWRKYQIHTINQLLGALHGACLRGLNVDFAAIKNSPIRKVLRSVQRMGAFTRLVTNSVLPLLRFLIFSAFAFHAEPTTTFWVYFVAIPIGILVLYLSARSASRNDYLAESLALSSSRELDQRILAVTLNRDYKIDIPENSRESSITLRLDRLLSSLIGAERTRFIISIMTIFLLAMVTVVSGVMNDDKHWGEILVYLLALILAFSQLSSVLSTASLFGRFYPTIVRYKQLCLWLSVADSGSNIQSALSNTSYQFTVDSDVEDLV